jgi:TolB-like protein
MTHALEEPIVTPGEVRVELQRILASPHFASSPQLTSFLRFIVTEALAGRSDKVKERTVACGALGRDARFDPRLDCVVRVVASKLRRSLEHYYALDGASDSVCIYVPCGSYCPVFLRKDETAASPSTHEPASAAPNQHSNSNGSSRPTVAVAPLRLFTHGPKERFLAEILADDVAVRLGRLGTLEVIDCLATGLSKTHRETVCESAVRMHADFVVTGSVSRVGDVVRSTARLIDGHSGAMVWGDQYDRVISKGLLAQQDDIADQIADGIGGFFRLG